MARVKFTAERLAQFSCPQDTRGGQGFLWDTEVPCLGFRATSAGARSFILQARFSGKTIRLTIGSPSSWSIGDARTEARRLQRLIDSGVDPRTERAEAVARQAAERDAAKVARAREKVRGLDAWAAYVEDRRFSWGELTAGDHLRYVSPGGAPRKRSKFKTTKPGVLHGLLDRPLTQIDAETVEKWLDTQIKTRPTAAALAYRMLRAFINWCAEQPEYRDLVVADACKVSRVRKKVPKPKAKDDALQREQLRSWFDAVRRDPNPAVVAYLQALLLTGARREELARLRWDDVDLVWKSLRIRDKVEGERVIPLTPYVESLLRQLKALNERPPAEPTPIRGRTSVPEPPIGKWEPSPWVFATRRGRLRDPRSNHMRALRAAGLPHLTLHGLRRSFGTLSEWCEVPVGIVAQIQGHKPSAIAEKHYRVRPLDLLRLWHQRIEAWILDQAGIPFSAYADQPMLKVAA